LSSGGQLVSFQGLVVTEAAAMQRLYDYWVNQFACPWFGSFDDALAAQPVSASIQWRERPRARLHRGTRTRKRRYEAAWPRCCAASLVDWADEVSHVLAAERAALSCAGE
jgi:hypothetical protein